MVSVKNIKEKAPLTRKVYKIYIIYSYNILIAILKDIL